MRNAFTKTIRLFSRVFLDELKLLFTDAGAVLFFVAAIFVYSFLYTLGYEKETVRDIPIAVVDLDHTSASRQYNRMIDATEQLQVTYHPGSLEEARLLFFDDRIKGVILIPEDFEKNILLGIQTNVIVYCDASYFMLYKQIYAGAVYATGTFGAGIEIKRMMAEGKSYQQAIDLRNPSKRKFIIYIIHQAVMAVLLCRG